MGETNTTHISVTIEMKKKIKELAQFEERSMRTVLKRLIDAEHVKLSK